MSNFKSNQNTFSIPCSIDYFRFGPGIGWYRYQVIGNRPSLIIVLRHACQFHVVTFLQLKSSLQLQRVSVVSHVKTTVFKFCENRRCFHSL